MQLDSEDSGPALPQEAPSVEPPPSEWLRVFFGSSWELQETDNFRLLVVALPKAFEHEYLAALRAALRGFETDAHHGEIVRGIIDGAAALARAHIHDG